MCLETIEKFKTNGKGFQVVRKRNENRYESWLRRTADVYTIGIPRKAWKSPIHTEVSREKYLSGFHVIIRKSDAVALLKAAKNYYFGCKELYFMTLVEVSYTHKSITATGWQRLGRVVSCSGEPNRLMKTVIASKSTILREVKQCV